MASSSPSSIRPTVCAENDLTICVAPQGTGAPGPSLLVSPLTLAAGPVVSYNLLALLACPLAAWSAFLLCRHVTGRFAPSLLGGYLFGFSTYMLGHVGIHVNLELVFPVPRLEVVKP